MTKIFHSPVIATEKLTKSIVRLRFQAPELARKAHCGHFINIRVSKTIVPLWRRPFSIHRVNREEGWAEILFRIVGYGTSLLSELNDNDVIEFIGLLGTPYKIPAKMKNAIIIAGGLGIAPVILLCQDLLAQNISMHLLYGVQNKSDLCCLDDLEKLNVTYSIATDDGSIGKKGPVTDMLEEFLKVASTGSSELFACGPMPMLARIQHLCYDYQLPGQVSVETLMACGFGACMGCNLPMKTNHDTEKLYKLACKDGPVFNINDISFDG